MKKDCRHLHVHSRANITETGSGIKMTVLGTNQKGKQAKFTIFLNDWATPHLIKDIIDIAATKKDRAADLIKRLKNSAK